MKTHMRTLGLIGGTSWHSTIEYYRHINQLVNAHFGNNTNPPLILFNLNQALVHQYQKEDRWSKIADLMIEAGERLQNGGAEAIIFCANTPHKVFDLVEKQLTVPILHIADATAIEIKNRGIRKVCFLGTKFSMEDRFITDRYANHGIDTLVPEKAEVILELHRIIHEELTFGKVLEASKQYVLAVIESMRALGAEGVVLGCTEFPLMLNEFDLTIPIFNTTQIHAEAATRFILSNELKD